MKLDILIASHLPLIPPAPWILESLFRGGHTILEFLIEIRLIYGGKQYVNAVDNLLLLKRKKDFLECLCVPQNLFY